jgi:hypothetical protein
VKGGQYKVSVPISKIWQITDENSLLPLPSLNYSSGSSLNDPIWTPFKHQPSELQIIDALMPITTIGGPFLPHTTYFL